MLTRTVRWTVRADAALAVALGRHAAGSQREPAFQSLRERLERAPLERVAREWPERAVRLTARVDVASRPWLVVELTPNREGLGWIASVVQSSLAVANRDCELDEVLARVRCTLAGAGVARIGGLVLDEWTGSATADAADLRLTPKQFAVLLVLMRRRGTAVSRQELCTLALRMHSRGGRAVIPHVVALRDKLPHTYEWIVTVYGAGYRFDPGVGDDEHRAAGDEVVYGSLRFDRRGHRALVAGRDCNLTPAEFEFLDKLVSHAGVVSRSRALRGQTRSKT